MKNFKDVWEDAAANSVSADGVDMPADVQHDKKKKKKAVYDGRTKEGRKFVEKMLARRKVKADAEQVNASKQNAVSVSMKEEAVEEAKKPVSKMTPAEKAADAKRRKEYNAYQKSKRNETAQEAKAPKIKGLSIYGSEVTGLRAKDGKMYSAKPVVMAGKLAYRVTDEFGSFETLPLKKFAAKFG
jgi:hypothetical protein